MSGLDLAQLKHLVVGPALAALGLDSAAAVNLVTGTALAETRAAWLHQIEGPALGLWQMEPATHDDCWTNFLDHPGQAHLRSTLLAMLASDQPRADQMVANLRYACAMARIRFYRAPEPLPDARSAAGLSAYHKSWYNTARGAADAQANIAFFQHAIVA